MRNRKLALSKLKVKSFVTEAKQSSLLKGGQKCPLYTHDGIICDLITLDPQGVTCNSTGNTDDPTGLSGTV
ncbi:MAG: pinensin family lanthipeptide [Cyclobacteriaceae bacterium]